MSLIHNFDQNRLHCNTLNVNENLCKKCKFVASSTSKIKLRKVLSFLFAIYGKIFEVNFGKHYELGTNAESSTLYQYYLLFIVSKKSTGISF